MKKSFIKKVLAVVLSVSLLIGGSSVAFALDGKSGNAITIQIGNDTAVGGASLEAAIGSTDKATIKTLTITAGKVTETDWTWIKALSKLETFTVADDVAVTSVANIPNDGSANAIFPLSIETVTIPKVKTIGESAFESSALTTASFPEVTKIGKRAFNACNALTGVDFPVATDIGESAFENCKNLTTASFPEVTKIGKMAFCRCYSFDNNNTTGLTTANFPKATDIGESAFASCAKLTTASFPAVKTIGTAAFNSCNALSSLTLGAAPPTVANVNAVDDCPKLNNPLTLVGADGKTLTDEALETAIAAYDAVTDATSGNADKDGKWYGWTLPTPPPPPQNVPVTGVTLDKSTLTLKVGENSTLTAAIAPANATDQSVTWSSSSDAIATVANGTVTAVKEGTATITVTTATGNFKATCAVTVTKASTPIDPPTAPTLPPITGGSNNSGSTSTATATAVTPTTKTDGGTTEVTYEDVTTSTEVIGDITAATAEITLDDTTATTATATNPIEIIVALSATDAAATISAATTKAVAFAFTVSDSISTNPYVYMKELKAGSDIIKAAATAGKDISFAVKSADGKLLFSMKFKGSELSAGGKSLADLNLAMNMLEPSAKIAKALQKSTVLSFQNNGVFPSPCTVTANVADVFSDGTVLNLYYDNAKNGTLELVENGLTVSFGEVQAIINHASDYILSETYLDPKNPTTNPATGVASTGVASTGVALLGKLF